MGDFSEAGGSTGSATRNRLAAFDVDGNLTGWNPGLSGGYARRPSSLLMTDGLIYAAGNFTGAGEGTGDSPVNGLVAFTEAGELSAWQPETDGPLYSIVSDGSDIYLGGSFSRASNGAAVSRRSGLAVFDASGDLKKR